MRYTERVLRTFGMRDCKPCATPLDANRRSYLVNMTRPDPRVCILSTEQMRTISKSSTFASCRAGIATCTCYLMSLNGGAISWRSSRQGGVTLSSSEAEFVAASQAGQGVVYLRVLLRVFGIPPKRSLQKYGRIMLHV
jgi:hypothetical protein